MKIQRKNRKAFSLIELLVATSIFSMSLVLAFAAFSLTLGNQSFVTASSLVNTEGDRLSRLIFDSIVNADQFGTTSGAVNSPTEIKGMLLFDINGTLINQTSGLCLTNASKNCNYAKYLLLFSESSLQIFFEKDGNLMQYSQAGNDLKLLPTGQVPIADIVASAKVINSDKVEIYDLYFSGSACYKKSGALIGCSQQPFTGFNLQLRTRDYDKKSAVKRAKFYVETSVTSRMQ